MEKALTKPLRSHLDYKIAWICALDIEIAAARLMLDATHDSLPQDPTDHNNYLLGEISGHNIVITCLPFGIYGTVSAACVGVQVRTTYPAIRFGLMVGIGGGIPSKNADVRLGDVVVSKPSRTFGGVIQYDFGKSIVKGVFERVGSLNGPPNVVLSAVSQLRAKYLTGDGCISDILSATFEKNPGVEQGFTRPESEDELFESAYQHSSGPTCDDCNRAYLQCRPARLSNDPKIHHGLVGSGNRVVKDASVRDNLADELGIICLEMEAAGFMNQIPTQVIRGICDYADSHKNKDWQGYASLAAAAYAKELLALIPTSHTNHTVSSSHGQMIPSHAPSQRGYPKKKARHVQIERTRILSRCYQLILGRLSMEVYRDTSTGTAEETQHVKMMVLPPPWISNTSFHIQIDQLSTTTHQHSAPQFCIRPISINQNIRLYEAIQFCDIKELKTLFATNQARPTDMIFDYEANEPVTLLESLLRAFIGLVPCPSRLWNHRRVLEFLLDMAQQPTEQGVNTFFFSFEGSIQTFKREQHGSTAFSSYFQRLLNHGGFSLEQVKLPSTIFVPKGGTHIRYGGKDGYFRLSAISTLVESGLGFESIHDCLFHPSQIWTTDELAMRDIWYIGVRLHLDKGFRAAFKEYLSGFQSSSFGTSRNNPALSVFNMDKIVCEVREAHISERSAFLCTLISHGTPEMVEPFLGMGIDLDESWMWNNYLGTAALQGKLGLVESMLNEGASGILAVPSLCKAHQLSDSDFDMMFLKFMDSIRKTQSIFNPSRFISQDPLLAIIRCSRALRASPDSIEILFSRGMFCHSSLYGCEEYTLSESYVFNSILYDRQSALKVFLSHGVTLDSRIGAIFSADEDRIGPVADHTRLTLAIELGRSACVHILIQSSNDFWEPGRQQEGQINALQFSKSLATGTHPRIPRMSAFYNSYHVEKDAPQDPVSLEEDATMYKALQTAFGLVCDDSEIASPDQTQVAIAVSHDKAPRANSDEARVSLGELCYVVVLFIWIYTIIFGYTVLNVAISLLARGQLFGRRGVLSSAALVFLAWMLYHVF